MARGRNKSNRVLGPTWIPSTQYWRIVVCTPGAKNPRERRITRHYREEDEARDVAAAARKVIGRNDSLTLEEAIEAYRNALHERGTGAVSYNETHRRLRLFFPDLDQPVCRVTRERAQTHYDAFRQRRKADGLPISVDYHRAALINARSFLSWCVEKGWLQENPLAGVKGVGRRNAGKPQPTGDETRRLFAFCLARAQSDDRAALGVLMALLMALRSSDITRRVVRDVDLDATVLRVERGKTRRSNRPRQIPALLRPMILRLVEARDPFEPLFKTPHTSSGFHTRRWLEEAMVRFCRAAEIPYFTPHALKGTAGSILAETGSSADVIADHLSHEETSTTRRHYVAEGAFEQGQTQRALKVLLGGKP